MQKICTSVATLAMVPITAFAEATLQAQQTAWLKYRIQECELVGALTGARGSWPSPHAKRREVSHTQQLLRRVRSAFACIQKTPTSDRLFSQNN